MARVRRAGSSPSFCAAFESRTGYSTIDMQTSLTSITSCPVAAITSCPVASTDALVDFLVGAPDDIIALWIKLYDLHLFYRLPVLCRRTREHFQLARRLTLAEAIGGSIWVTRHHTTWWMRLPNQSEHVRHSLFGPALVFADGTRAWYWLGYLHRSGDLPAVVDNQLLEWWRHGDLHRRTADDTGYRPAQIEWGYNPDAYVTRLTCIDGVTVSKWTTTCFDSDADVDKYVDAAAGVPWRE